MSKKPQNGSNNGLNPQFAPSSANKSILKSEITPQITNNNTYTEQTIIINNNNKQTTSAVREPFSEQNKNKVPAGREVILGATPPTINENSNKRSRDAISGGEASISIMVKSILKFRELLFQ